MQISSATTGLILALENIMVSCMKVLVITANAIIIIIFKMTKKSVFHWSIYYCAVDNFNYKTRDWL